MRENAKKDRAATAEATATAIAKAAVAQENKEPFNQRVLLMPDTPFE